jgi:hypothetical protein
MLGAGFGLQVVSRLTDQNPVGVLPKCGHVVIRDRRAILDVAVCYNVFRHSPRKCEEGNG